MSPVQHGAEQKPPSLGRGAPKGETTHYILCVAFTPSKCVRCARRQATEEQRQLFADFFGVPQGFAQLLPEEGALRYGMFFFVTNAA